MNHWPDDVTQHIQEFGLLAPRTQRKHLLDLHGQTSALDWNHLQQSHALLHEGPARPANPLEERAREIRRKRAETARDEVRNYLRQQLYAAYHDDYGPAEDDPTVHYVATDDGTLVKITVELA